MYKPLSVPALLKNHDSYVALSGMMLGTASQSAIAFSKDRFMAIETDVLVALFEVDALHNEDGKVTGIAQRAVDNGFESLTPRQKNVINHLLSRACEGVTNPGDHHNDCQANIAGQDLIDATTQSGYFDGWLCENCRNESEGYEIERARFMAD